MNKKSLIIFIVLALIVGAVGGYFYGADAGKKSADANLKALVEVAFPAPANEIYSIDGQIKEIHGAVLTLETDSFDDYLPHVDGTEKKTENRYVTITPDTKMSSVNIFNVDENGTPITKDLSFENLSEGMWVTAWSSENIRNAKEFNASELKVFEE